MPDIHLENLVKRFTRIGEPAVNDVSLHVKSGEFLCVLGPSGCGKTTILRMIAGLEQLTEGTIAIDGELVDSVNRGCFLPPEMRKLGLVFQSYALWPHMTVFGNIEFGLRMRKISSTERRSRVREVMHKLHIEGLDARYPSQLSGGQQQRVALARMLVVNPGVLLLDEPLSNLDAALRLQMRSELSRLHREFGTTIIFVTHDQWEAMTLANRIAVMSKGKLQQVGSPDEIYGLPANQFVAEFIGNPPINIVPATSDFAAVLTSAGMAGDLSDLLVASTAIGIRPEGVLLSREAKKGVSVTLRTVLPTGGAWILELEHKAHENTTSIYGVTHDFPIWQLGQELFASIRHDSLHFFAADGQRHSMDRANIQQMNLLSRSSTGEML